MNLLEDLKETHVKQENDLSGWLTPDGKFYYAEYGCHSSVLDDILSDHKYSNMYQHDFSFGYFSHYDESVDIEIGEMTQDFKRELKRFAMLMSPRFLEELELKLAYVNGVTLNEL